jgi:hypothetical protein
VQPGIYRVSASGGDASLFAKDAKMVFPNGLVFGAAGNLFVTDSAAGTIFEIAQTGAVSPWASSAILARRSRAVRRLGQPVSHRRQRPCRTGRRVLRDEHLDAGVLEAQGNLRRPRWSEVRLPGEH